MRVEGRGGDPGRPLRESRLPRSAPARRRSGRLSRPQFKPVRTSDTEIRSAGPSRLVASRAREEESQGPRLRRLVASQAGRRTVPRSGRPVSRRSAMRGAQLLGLQPLLTMAATQLGSGATTVMLSSDVHEQRGSSSPLSFRQRRGARPYTPPHRANPRRRATHWSNTASIFTTAR